MQAEDLLPDDQNILEMSGIPVRKGTVGAFLANARAALAPGLSMPARSAALHDLEALLPQLQALGLFKILEIRDPGLRAWVQARLPAEPAGMAAPEPGLGRRG